MSVLCFQVGRLIATLMGWLLKVKEIFKGWLSQFHTPSEFPWLSGDLKPLLQSPSPLLDPLHHARYLKMCFGETQCDAQGEICALPERQQIVFLINP